MKNCDRNARKVYQEIVGITEAIRENIENLIQKERVKSKPSKYETLHEKAPETNKFKKPCAV